MVSARKVDKKLKQNKRHWYKDRTYPHTFINFNEIW